MRNTIPVLILLAAYGCGETAKLPVGAVTGPNPTLVEPKPQVIPTFRIAPAKGWAPGSTPIAADGFAVNAFATGLDHPR
jgi:glucose/arabinose dehydrogenase